MDSYFHWEGYGTQFEYEENNFNEENNDDHESYASKGKCSSALNESGDVVTPPSGVSLPGSSGGLHSPDRQNAEVPTNTSNFSYNLDEWNKLIKVIGIQKMPWELTPDDVFQKVFQSIENAEKFFNLYATTLGFSVRKGQKRVGVDGHVHVREWWCSKEGHRRKRVKSDKESTRQQKPLTRDGCKVHFRITRDKKLGAWVVKDFYNIHSHPLACADHIQFLRSNRSITAGTLKMASTMRTVGVQTSQILSYMAVQLGGYNKVPFTPKDLYNAMYRQHEIALQDSDAAKAIGYLQHKSDHDSDFYAKYTINARSHLENLLWCDSRSKVDYKVFGHVLAFDTTYRSNKYGKPLLVLVGINHHYKTCIFAVALIKDESLETYTWALETFLECMDGVCPKTVITDGDQAMQGAIQRVIPSCVHRLCAWHLQRNAVSNVKDRVFITYLQKFFRKQYSEIQFELKWKAMINKLSLQDNVWVQSLYDRRHRWAETYFRGHFFGGMTTTQRCEGMNWFLKSKGKSTMTLSDFVRGVDMSLSWMRYNEAMDDYESTSTTPVLGSTNMSVLETEAARLFTRTMFHQIRAEMVKEGKYMVKQQDVLDDQILLSLVKYGNEQESLEVYFQVLPRTFYCSCDLMSRKGIPCRHIFACMKSLNITNIPPQLINKRWTKAAKSGAEFKPHSTISAMTTPQLAQTRFGQLSNMCTELAFIGSTSESQYALALQQITNVVDLLKKNQMQSTKDTDHEESPQCNFANLLNPLPSKTKGSGVRLSSGNRKMKKCSQCKRHGHNKKTCKQAHQKPRDDPSVVSDDDNSTYADFKKYENSTDVNPLPSTFPVGFSVELNHPQVEEEDLKNNNHWWGSPYGS